MKSSIAIKFLWLLACVFLSFHGLANNIVVSNISLTNRNTSTQTVRVNFNLNWENSWRTTSAPFNWDAAWVFVKYRVGTTGEWKHATLATTGHTLPGIAAATQTDATGIFIYRSAAGTGNFNPTGIQLQWNYGIDGVANEAQIFVRVFAIEMVYNHVGGFQAGSGGHTTGELRTANDVSVSGTATTFTITGSLPTVQGNNSSSSPTNIAARLNGSNDISGTTTASLAAGYPTGFNAFYSMKYEISQQQYVDFLNTLTYTQQAARTATPPNSAVGTGALINPNINRNGIVIQTPGTASTVPAVYACNLDGDGSYNEADDGQHIACNYLSWDDLDAYLDWAGLRPMTELEFEKSCRGNTTPTSGEYPWGTATAVKPTGINNTGNASETASNGSANIAFDINSIGPVRTGLFATGSSNRNGSGGGYYGNMDLGGNLWERVVTLGNNAGRAFSGNHGNGTLHSNGDADVVGWPDATGTGWRGGAYDLSDSTAIVSRRTLASNGNNSRVANAGGRGVRTISPGIVTDGLVLWLDAGIVPSYGGSGTIWTDLSGNRNNGSLINGPTFNSGNEGSIAFDGVNDYAEATVNNFFTSYSQEITMETWVYIPSAANWTNGFISAIFTRGQFGGSHGIWRNNIDNSVIAYFRQIGAGVNFAAVSTTGNISRNNWFQLVATWSANTASLYINGSLSSSASGTLGLTTSDLPFSWGRGFPIGAQSAEGIFFTGNQALSRIYSRALNASEVLQNFNAQKARFGL